MTVTELARLGGKARAKLSKEELSRIGKLGGRPKKLDKSAIHKSK